jgi:hypothetical protein
MQELLHVLGCCEWCCCRALLSGSGRSSSRKRAKREENKDTERVESFEQPEAEVDKELEVEVEEND